MNDRELLTEVRISVGRALHYLAKLNVAQPRISEHVMAAISLIDTVFQQKQPKLKTVKSKQKEQDGLFDA